MYKEAGGWEVGRGVRVGGGLTPSSHLKPSFKPEKHPHRLRAQLKEKEAANVSHVPMPPY